MTTHNPIFTASAVIAAVVCFMVMEIGRVVGWVYRVCKRIDAAVDRLVKIL